MLVFKFKKSCVSLSVVTYNLYYWEAARIFNCWRRERERVFFYQSYQIWTRRANNSKWDIFYRA